ncbi:SMAD domain, Dwarfin-type and SMAD/FHA domain and SMAD domain-like-containing protein [Strongyloides ratti]|uniref:SMAD domain, Dwarfin-type and SMAD/FHA domain and SMAD domain-like-containing protein n=1 Tax=Strongyloides ratti TaxID=34506 RepID=A0A090LGK8_STRRB|nr:SMAD domain, Dwarfin-type and SMAD/FHA domain and SMAD domain-like-containing protein [Strongyloides ratti]CEF68936.1 SMAD domain, Dwarfin-type and SMAD/FHA domain and SMAD domain-like-containing protein [Strongyloides ratti]
MFQEVNHSKIYCSEDTEKINIENNCESIIDEDMWYDIDQFQLDHLNEVLQRLSEGTLDDEIWGKLIIMEKNRRIAKAYLRKTTIIVDGGDEEFDGMTIGFNYFSNPDRDHQTSELRKKIGDGVIIKMDSQGNIKAMARGAAPVIVQNWKNNKKHCIGEKLLRLQGKLITKRGIDMSDDDRIFKVFDMKKFKISLERDSFETEEDVKNILLKTCLRVALVKDGQPDDPMETPCWFMLINLVALDMIKTKMPHIADLNCMYGELGCPSIIPSIKRSALKEQIESSNILSNSKRRSQSYYEILSDDGKKHNLKMSSNYEISRRKGKRNHSSSDDSEESNTEVNPRYNHNVINSRFLKPYSGSITDSSSGFASGTDKRSFSSDKRSCSDLTKSVDDLKISHNDNKQHLNPGIKIPGLRPKLDKTLFDPPYSSKKNNGLIRKRSSLQDNDRERRREYRNSCNMEEIYDECSQSSREIDNTMYVDKEKYLNETYTNSFPEASRIDDEGKDFDIKEALKNVDESFNYLQTGDYYSDTNEIEENNWRESILSLNNNNEGKKNDDDDDDSDDTFSSQSPLPHSDNLHLLDRYRGIRKPITKYNNYLQTIDRVRSKSSKNTNNGKSDVLFNRSETIKINSISSSSPLEIVDVSCQFFKSQEQEYTLIVWKEWHYIKDKLYSSFKIPSISIVNVEYDFVKNTSLTSISFDKGIPNYENEYTTIKKLDLQPQRQSITCLQITDTYNKPESWKSNINQVSTIQLSGEPSKTTIHNNSLSSNILQSGKETTILQISDSPPPTLGTSISENQQQQEFRRSIPVTSRVIKPTDIQKKEHQSMELNRTPPNSVTSARRLSKESSGNVSQTTSLQEQKQSHQTNNSRTTINHFEENPVTSTAISIRACQNSPTSQNQSTTILQSKHQNPNINYRQYQATPQGQYGQHLNQFNHPLQTAVQWEQHQPERIYMERNGIRNMAEKDYQQRRARSHSRTIQTRQPDQSSHFSRNTNRKPTGLEKLLHHARTFSKSSNHGSKNGKNSTQRTDKRHPIQQPIYSTLPRPLDETKVWIQKHVNPTERIQVGPGSHYHQPFPIHPPPPLPQQLGNEIIYQTLPIYHQQEVYYCSPREMMRREKKQGEEIYMRTQPMNGPIMRRRLEEGKNNSYMRETHLNQSAPSTPSLIYSRNHQYPQVPNHANGPMINGMDKIYQRNYVQLRSPSMGRIIPNMDLSKEEMIYGSRSQIIKGYWENPPPRYHHVE